MNLDFTFWFGTFSKFQGIQMLTQNLSLTFFHPKFLFSYSQFQFLVVIFFYNHPIRILCDLGNASQRINSE